MTLKLASGSYDGTIRFWDPSTGSNNNNQTIKLSGAIPNKIEISEDKKKLVVAMNNCVKIYDIEKPDRPETLYRTFDLFKGNVISVGFIKQDKTIYAACEDGSIKIFDIKNKSVMKEMKQNIPLTCAIAHPNECDIISGDESGELKIWSIDMEKEKVKVINEQERSIRSITVSQNGQHIIIADKCGYISSYYGEELVKVLKPTQVHDDYILKVLLSPNNKYLTTCSADKKIKLFKVHAESQKLEITDHKTLKSHMKWVWDCQFSCDSAYLISCSTDMTLKLWEVEKGELMQTLKGHEKGVVCLAMNDIADINV